MAQTENTQIDFNEIPAKVMELQTNVKALETATASLDASELGVLNSVTPGTAAASKAAVLDANKRLASVGGFTGLVAGVLAGFMPSGVQQAINANGAINITTFYTAITSVGTTGVTFTLADSTQLGQLKKIQMIVDDGDATVTFNTNATIVFADVGDFAVLMWNGSDWIPIELGNSADGATAPVYTAAS